VVENDSGFMGIGGDDVGLWVGWIMSFWEEEETRYRTETEYRLEPKYGIVMKKVIIIEKITGDY